MKKKIMEELDSLVVNLKRGEDDLRKQNSVLRLKLDKTMNALEE
jgi:uncharacterized protein YaaN involved in tellurite resistance